MPQRVTLTPDAAQLRLFVFHHLRKTMLACCVVVQINGEEGRVLRLLRSPFDENATVKATLQSLLAKHHLDKHLDPDSVELCVVSQSRMVFTRSSNMKC